MTIREERLTILRMVEEGKISPDEGSQVTGRHRRGGRESGAGSRIGRTCSTPLGCFASASPTS